MTVNEMHIAVNLGVQKIASFQVDNLLPQEIDHELNLAMTRFVKQRYSAMSNRYGRGFEQSQKRIDDLRTLVVEHTGITSYQGVVFNSNYSDIYIDRYTFPLDYLFLVSVRAKVEYECNTNIQSLIDTTETTTDVVKVNLTPPQSGYYITDIYGYDTSGNLVQLTNSSSNEITHDILVNSENYFHGIIPMTNFPYEESLGTSVHISPIADSNSIFLMNPAGWSSASFSSSGGQFVEVRWTNGDGAYLTTYSDTRETYILTNRTYAGGSTRISLVKFAQHDDILYMLDDPFNRVDYKTPLYTIEENYIDVHTDNEFVVPEVTIKYIRRPDDISIINGIGCELPEHTHTEIVEMTIKSILEGIQDPRYQTQTMETFESE
jgi:hypothetical protein